MVNHDLIVIGASAGGVEALKALVPHLPQDLPAAIGIVLHTMADTTSALPEILGRLCPLMVKLAENDEALLHGTVYIAPPDCHLLVNKGLIRVRKGPRENGVRPAIDPLFRSAAVAYSSRVIGVVLSGMQDDGTAGLIAIKRCGGMALVQCPDDALYKDMPKSAMANVQIDSCLPVSEIGAVLSGLVQQPSGKELPVPEDILMEVMIAEGAMTTPDMEKSIGKPTTFHCPDCGGALWELTNDGMLRYRCTVGHAFTARNLMASQTEHVEQALWAAVRSLEERIKVINAIANDFKKKGAQPALISDYEQKAEELRKYFQVVRNLLAEKVTI